MKIEDVLTRLRPVLGEEETDRLWKTYISLSSRNRAWYERVLRLRLAKLVGSTFEDKDTLLEPPAPDIARGGYPLGTVCYGGTTLHPFGLREEELIQHVGIFGRSGSGKTNIGFEFVLNLLKKGKPFLIFDWKRNYRDLKSLPEAKDIRIFTVGRNVAPFYFNPLIPPKGTQPTVWLKKLIEIMGHAYFLGEGCAYLLLKAIDTVYRQKGVYDREPGACPTIGDVRDWLVSHKTKGREAAWMESTLRAVGTLCFGEVGDVLNSASPTPLEELLEMSVILELDALTKDDKIFLIESMLLWLHHYRLAQGERETFKHAVIIEEAHHILSRKKQEVKGEEEITDIILREIRELGEGIVLLDQHPSLISKPGLGNTYCTIAMNLKHRGDTRMIADCLHLDTEQTKALTRLEVGWGLVKLQDRYMKPFLVKFPLIEVRKASVTEDMIAVPRGERDAAPTRAGVPGRGKEEGIQRGTCAIGLTTEERGFLEDVSRFPLSSVRKRYCRLGFGCKKGNRIQKSLVSRGLIASDVVVNEKGRMKVVRLTEKGKEAIGLDRARTRRLGGSVHEYWKKRIAGSLAARGYEVREEYPLGEGKAVDLVAEKKGRRAAIEVETGRSDAVANIRKCLDAGFERILCCTTTDALRDDLRAQAKRLAFPDGLSIVTVKELLNARTDSNGEGGPGPSPDRPGRS